MPQHYNVVPNEQPLVTPKTKSTIKPIDGAEWVPTPFDGPVKHGGEPEYVLIGRKKLAGSKYADDSGAPTS